MTLWNVVSALRKCVPLPSPTSILRKVRGGGWSWTKGSFGRAARQREMANVWLKHVLETLKDLKRQSSPVTEKSSLFISSPVLCVQEGQDLPRGSKIKERTEGMVPVETPQQLTRGQNALARGWLMGRQTALSVPNCGCYSSSVAETRMLLMSLGLKVLARSGWEGRGSVART